MLSKYIEVTKLANQLMREHGLFDPDPLNPRARPWKFEISKTKRIVGRCNYTTRTIEFSHHYLNSSDEQIRDTILHEIAHALAGNQAGHGYKWQQIAASIGAAPERCAPATPDVVNTAKHNYVLECSGCGKKWYRYRLRKEAQRAYCATCNLPIKAYKLVHYPANTATTTANSIARKERL